MPWPTPAQFNTMMQNPPVAFRDAELKTSSIERDSVGLPRARSGAFAVVYRAILANQESRAVRVFSSDIPARRERYQAIHDHLSGQRLDCLVPFTYSDKGFRAADGKWYPLITMEWVKGDTLFDWLQRQTETASSKSISNIADQWRDTVQQLGKAQIAHGDLQHANVMITPNDEIKLVDYDGMCVPKLVGLKNEEIGVEPYQHPQRDGNTQLTLSLDNFSSVFIYVGLKALSADHRLWHDFVVQPEYDKLLFRKEDFSHPTQSALINRLRKSPDGDVQRLTSELCDLWRTQIDQVPKLDDFLFSFDQVKVLLDKRDFDGAVALVTRNNKGPQDAPPDLQPRITNAQQRIAKRSELEAAVNAADEAGMAALVGSPLLQGYPKAAEALAFATDAPSVVDSLQRIEAAKAAGDWRKFVAEWEAAQPTLNKPKGKLRKSAAKHEVDAVRWREKNAICDQLLGCLKAPEPDATLLTGLWKQLTDRGGHPESAPHQQTIENLIKRDHAWKAFKKVPRNATAATDKAIVGAWNEALFVGWSPAESERHRVDLAKKRLESLSAFQAAAQSVLAVHVEQQVIALAKSFPSDYAEMVSSRLELAQKRMKAVAALEHALAADSDTEIAGSIRELKSLEADGLAAPEAQTRIRVAIERADILSTLHQIPSSYSPADALRWDEKLIALWNEDLLNGCRDAAAWTESYRVAIHRRKLLKELAGAISSEDTLLGAKLAKESCLQGYMFDEKQKKWIESAYADVRCLHGMIDGLHSANRKQFADHFNAKLVRSHSPSLKQEWHKLVDWVKSDVLPTQQLGLAPPKAQRPLEVDSSSNQRGPRRCTMRWNWPDNRFSDECHIAICRHRPVQGDSPDSHPTWLSFRVTREMYQTGGGYRRQTIDPAWLGSYVVVWAKIDLGRDVLWSEPLLLGKV